MSVANHIGDCVVGGRNGVMRVDKGRVTYKDTSIARFLSENVLSKMVASRLADSYQLNKGNCSKASFQEYLGEEISQILIREVAN